MSGMVHNFRHAGVQRRAVPCFHASLSVNRRILFDDDAYASTNPAEPG